MILTTDSFLYPAVDIKGGLDKITNGLQNGNYNNEYDFQLDIMNLVMSAKDEHFNFYPDITQIFFFLRSNNLYSVSKDGQALPEVYMDLDIDVLGFASWKNYTASPVTKINGKPVENFLNDLADQGGAQDPDANYNALFPVIPLVSTNQPVNPPAFQYSATYQGSSTVVTFKNGTTRKIETFASTSMSFKGVVDGTTFFKKFCPGASGTVSSAIPSGSQFPSAIPSASFSGSASASFFPSASASVPAVSPVSTQVSYSPVPSQTVVPAPSAFPKPWSVASDWSIACYFPEDNKDLAVLSAPTFGPAVEVEFQDVIRECLATSAKMGKKKLIIDLRGNGGGTVILAYDWFKQLFPSMAPWGTSNFHAFDLFNDIGQTVTEKFDSNNPGRESLTSNFGSIFNVDNELDTMDDQFSSWSDFYGPVHTHGDTFTNLVRYNLTNKADTGLQHGLSGYGNLTNIVPKQTFSADNIVILQDGACASTCAVFAEFMKTQGKVKTIAIGGRSQTGPMQGVGGVKGANVYGNDYLIQIMEEGIAKDASKSEAKQLFNKYGTEVQAMYYATLRAAIGSEGHVARVNIRNNIRKGDTTRTPLQFVYEAADCRLFYTAPMMVDQETVWATTYEANWGNGNCVKGSTGQASSKPGTGYIEKGPSGDSTYASGYDGPSGTSSGSKSTQTGAAGRTTLGFGGVVVGMMSLIAAFSLL